MYFNPFIKLLEVFHMSTEIKTNQIWQSTDGTGRTVLVEEIYGGEVHVINTETERSSRVSLSNFTKRYSFVENRGGRPRFWTTRRKRQLLDAVKSGRSFSQIASSFGTTERAVRDQYSQTV